MNLANYPILTEFEGQAYSDIIDGWLHREWETPQSRRFQEWYNQRRAASAENLRVLGRSDDLSIPFLGALLRDACLEDAFARKLDYETTAFEVNEHMVTMPAFKKAVTQIGWALTFDIGIVFGDELLRRHPGLSYAIVKTRRKVKDAYEGLPSIFGFPMHVHCYPPRIALGIANAELEHPGVELRLVRAFESWQSQAP